MPGFSLPYWLLATIHRRALDARRREHSWRYLGWSVLVSACAAGLVAIAGAVTAALWAVGLWWLGVIAVLVLATPFAAAPIVRYALVPLGAARAAYYLGTLAWNGRDPAAYGLCCAAWAFAHRPTPAAEAWIARRRAARVPLGDGEIAATALLVAGRGDLDTARQLLRSLDSMVEVHPAVRELAGEWLAVDAAARGAWRELADEAAAARWPATALTFLLEGIALRRVAAAGAPRGLELWARWIVAPRRRATWPLLALADARPAAPPSPRAAGGSESAGAHADPHAPGAASAPAPTPLAHAVARHLAIVEPGAEPPAAAELAAAVGAWDAALLSPATAAWLARRSIELDAPVGSVDRALREVASAVTAELAQVADAHQLAPPADGGPRGPVGEGVARRLRHGRLDALEQAFTRWAERRHSGEPRAAIDEWRELVALRHAYTAITTAGGAELRRLAFPHAHSAGSNMAAWLWNTRQEYALSHAISRWLLAEALAVGDAEAIELGHRNCSLAVPTHLGELIDDLPGPRGRS